MAVGVGGHPLYMRSIGPLERQTEWICPKSESLHGTVPQRGGSAFVRQQWQVSLGIAVLMAVLPPLLVVTTGGC